MDIWWLKSDRDEKRTARDARFRERNKKPRQQMYLCEECSIVWERSVYVGYQRYKDMPTYGLKRKYCEDCELEHATT